MKLYTIQYMRIKNGVYYYCYKVKFRDVQFIFMKFHSNEFDLYFYNIRAINDDKD